ncbi:MAG: AAA family ATPase [bacterium]|nr:AAA family ATPase [bacterium]
MNDDIILEPTLLRAVWRYRWLVLLIAIVATAGAYFYADATATEEFSAEASVIAEDPLSSIIFESSTVRRADYLADQVEFMRSGDVAEEAVRLALESDPNFPYKTGVELLDRVRIFEFGARITVRVIAETESAAVDGANSMIGAYQGLVLADAGSSFTKAIEVLNGILAELQQELVDIAVEIEDAQNIADPVLAELRAQYDEALPRMFTLIEELETATGEARDELLLQLDDISTQLVLVEQVNRIEGTSSAISPLLERQRRAIIRVDDLSEERDRFRVDAQLLGAGIGSRTVATFATRQATDILQLVAAGLFLGLLVGSGLAYMLALRRRSITDRGQPELVLAAPLIAEVPNFRQEGIRTSIPVRSHPRSAAAESFRFAAAALDLSRAAPMGTVITQGKLVVVTSAGVADGKSVVAANTALAAAREGKRVLLIDADFGSQMATEMLTETHPKAGITEVVESGTALSEAVMPIEGSGTSGLHLLARGWQTSSAPEFFRNPATREFLDQIQDFYDLILVDAPPLLTVAYASTLAGMVDKVLVVTRHNGSATALEELQDRLDLIGTPTVGYVYNLAPLRLDISRNEGSMRDVLGQPATLDDDESTDDGSADDS